MTNAEQEDPERARTLVAYTLSKYVGTVDKSRVSTAMALVIPTLMARATADGEETYQETSAQLLEIAAADQGAFRAVVGAMSNEQKTFLEEVIRSGRQPTDGAGKAVTGGSGQPTIALKMNFGG